MARQLDPRLQEILQQYHPNPKAAVWDCHGVWVIYHKAVELIAAKAGVKFSEPKPIESNAEKKICVLCVTDTLGDHSEWSIGEAAPYNNKNSYPYAMAEKRAKDRVVLKLVGLHGEIYSEDESEDFKQPSNANSVPVVADTENKTERQIANELIGQIRNISSLEKLGLWANRNAETISELDKEIQSEIRSVYSDHRHTMQAAA